MYHVSDPLLYSVYLNRANSCCFMSRCLLPAHKKRDCPSLSYAVLCGAVCYQRKKSVTAHLCPMLLYVPLFATSAKKARLPISVLCGFMWRCLLPAQKKRDCPSLSYAVLCRAVCCQCKKKRDCPSLSSAADRFSPRRLNVFFIKI